MLATEVFVNRNQTKEFLLRTTSERLDLFSKAVAIDLADISKNVERICNVIKEQNEAMNRLRILLEQREDDFG